MNGLVIALVLGIASVAMYHMLRLRRLGRQLAVLGPGSIDTDEYQGLLDSKRSTFYCLFGNLLTLLTVVFIIEVAARSLPHHRDHPWLLSIHLAFDAAFFVLLILLRWKPGHRSRRFHRIAGRGESVLFAGSFLTGLALLSSLSQLR